MFEERELIAKLRDALRRVADLERKEFSINASPILAFQNGLTRTGDIVRLGGILTQHTAIDGDTGLFRLTINDLESFELQANGLIRITADGHSGDFVGILLSLPALRMVIDAARLSITGEVGIGFTGDPAGPLHVVSDNAVGLRAVLDGYGSGATNFNGLYIRRARGTLAAPTIVANGDALGSIDFGGYDGDQFFPSVALYGFASGTIANNRVPGRLEFATTPDVASTPGATHLVIEQRGNIVVGTYADDGTLATTATDGFLHIPLSAGAPTGTPTVFTGRVPVHYDSTNNIFYVYDGAWIPINPAPNPIPTARIYNSGNLSINNATATALTFDSERWDTAALHSTAVNTSRLTAPVAGRYQVSATVRFDANATGVRWVFFRLNGATDYASHLIQAVTTGGNPTDIAVSTLVNLAVNDYMECFVYQDSGGALNVAAAGNFSPEFMMQYLG